MPYTLSKTVNAPYVSFEATVGRNSAFHMLTADELDELGGVEYRALNALLWIVGFVGFIYSFRDNIDDILCA